MKATMQILPVTGRRTIRRMVEGAIVLTRGCVGGPPPSVSPMGCHLPMNGEEFL